MQYQIKPIHRCPGVTVMEELHTYREYRTKTGQVIYLSPEEVKYSQFFSRRGSVSCQWPNCPCDSTKVSGVFRKERIDMIIAAVKQDPSISRKDFEFEY